MPTIRKRGKRWQAQVRIKVDGVIVFQESATRDTKGAADLWGLQLEEEVRRNGWLGRTSETCTVRELLEKYADLKSKVKALGRGFEHSLNAVAYGPLGKRTLKELTSAMIVEWGTPPG